MKLSQSFGPDVPLLVAPARLRAYLDAPAAKPAALDWADFFPPAEEPSRVGSAAIIPIKGCIGSGLTNFEKMCGAVDMNDVSDWLDDAEEDDGVTGVLLDFDTPGGIVTGVPELAARIAAFPKPVVSFTGGYCCSAGYWLASQARAVAATPSACVGSVGVYLAILDWARAYDATGIRVELIKSGDLKAAGFPGVSLTDDQRAQLLAQVVGIHSDFKNAVTARRKFVEADSMRGQSFYGKEAAARGLVSALVTGKAEALALLSRMG